jgi:hypothetical protein
MRFDRRTWLNLVVAYIPNELHSGIHTGVDKITDWPSTNQFPKAMK